MRRTIELGEDVFCDLQQIVRFLSRRHSDLGLRFSKATREAFALLVDHPLIGRPRPEFQVEGLRSWPVPKFHRYTIFYLEPGEAVRVLRVLNGSRQLSPELFSA